MTSTGNSNGKLGHYHTDDECEDAHCPVHAKHEFVPRKPDVHNGAECGKSCTDTIRIRGYCERHFRQLFVEKAERERAIQAGLVNSYNDEIRRAKAEQGDTTAGVRMLCKNCGKAFLAATMKLTLNIVNNHELHCSHKPKQADTSKPRQAAKPKTPLSYKDLF